MKNLLLIFFLVISIFSFGQYAPTAGNINSVANGTTVLHYNRIGDKIYITYPKYFNSPGENYPVSYPGTVYFVSNEGSDSNSGLTTEAPFLSVDKANSLSLSAGDAVLFKSGDYWSDTLEVGYSGNSTYPITYGAYGDIDSLPQIYGSELITGWTLRNAGGSIYVAKANKGTAITQLFVDDVKMQVARYDNAGTMFNVTGVTSTTVFTSSEIATQTDDYYNDAVIFIRSDADYQLEKETVSNYVSATKTLTISSIVGDSTITTSTDFMLMGKFAFLDEAGEWFYDAATDSVYIWKTDSTAVTNTEVRGSTIANGIYINAKNYVTVKNLNILQQKETGILTNGTCNYLIFDNNTIEDIENYGIYGVNEMKYATIINNTISRINSLGILAGTVSDRVGSGFHTITDNVITDIGLYDNLGLAGYDFWRDNCSAIHTGGRNTIISYNRIINSAYNGIRFLGRNMTISNNYIENVGSLLTDGGSIYAWAGTTTAIDSTSGTVISDNIINGHTGLAGIYMDNNMQGVTVEDNTVFNCFETDNYPRQVMGIMIKGKDNVISNNTIFNNDIGFGAGSTYSNIQFRNNIINNIVTSPSSRNWIVKAILASWNTTADSNKYIDRTRTVIFRKEDPTAATVDFATWKTLSSQDAASTFTGTALNANETEQIFYNDSKVAEIYYVNNATAVKNNVTGTDITGSFTLQPFTSIIIRGLNLDVISTISDAVAPTVLTFAVPDSSGTTVTVTTFTALGTPTKYIITESATPPELINANWTTTAPTTYVTGGGTKTLYAWVRDAAGNVSASLTDTVVVTLELPPVENLVGFWELNETSGTNANDEISTNDGTASGGVTVNQTGKLTKAFSFATDGKVLFTTPTICDAGMTSDFTICIWANVTTLTAASRLIQVNTNTSNYVQLLVDPTVSAISVELNKAATKYKFRTATGAITTGGWHWYVITFDTSENNLDFFVDNVLQTTTDASYTSGNTTNAMMLGARVTGTSAFYTGLLDQLIIINKVITEDERNGMYNVGDGLEYSEW